MNPEQPQFEQEQKSVSFVHLTPDDWERYRELRLKALQTDPTAFGRLYEEEVEQSEEEWRAKLAGVEQGRPDYYFAESEGKLVGTAGVRYEKGKMFEHMATIVGVYTDPEYRGKGIGEKLMREIINKLHSHPKITKIRLSVNAPQEAAKKMYEKLGFKQSGYSRNEAKIGDQFIDQIQMDLIFEDKIGK